jgi:hypothetical protein
MIRHSVGNSMAFNHFSRKTAKCVYRQLSRSERIEFADFFDIFFVGLYTLSFLLVYTLWGILWLANAEVFQVN